MKKYTETKNRAPFDWNAALSKDCKDMNLREAGQLKKRSESWVTCACGNQCEIIPREKDGTPLNKKLDKLGVKFHLEGVYEMYNNLANSQRTSGQASLGYMRLANNSRRKAIRTLKRIEILSGKLIETEILKAKNTLIKFGYKIS
jgi:hypothetical protein